MNRDSAVIIGISIVVGCLVLGIVLRQPAVAREGAAGDVGRYQIIRASDCNVMVLDTRTGRSWTKFVSPNEGPVHWSEDGPDVSPPAQGNPEDAAVAAQVTFGWSPAKEENARQAHKCLSS